MPGPNTIINFSAPLSNGDTLTLQWGGATATETFVPLRTTSGQTTIGTNAQTQAANYAAALSIDFAANFNVYYPTGADYVVVNSIATNNTISATSTSGNISFVASTIGHIDNVDPDDGCVYFTLFPSYTESGVAIETSINGGLNWTFSPGGTTSPRCPNGEVTVPTLYRLRGLNTFSGQTSNVYSLIPEVMSPSVIKCRSPYLLIKPSDIGGTCGIYTLGTTSGAAFTYQQCLTGEEITQIVGPSSIEYTSCAIVGSVTGPTGTTITYDSACDGSFDFDTAKYIIKAWNGNIAIPPSTISYSKTKQKVANVQTNIYINLSNLLKEELEGDINNYILPTGLTASPLGPNESKWANVVTTFDNLGATVSGISYNDTFFVLDGYTEPGEEQGLIRPFSPGWPQRILMSNWFDRTYTRFRKAKIHFLAEGLVSIDAYPGGVFTTTPIPISFDTNWLDSDKYIQAIDIDTSQNMYYQFNYGYDGEIVRTHVTDFDCKFKNFVVMFKNKWGVIESVCFVKKSSRTLTTEDSTYLRSIVDYNGSFDISRHTNKSYNTSGYEEWTLNTDWLPEYMNVPLQELVLSEEIWLFDGFTPIPINKSETQFSFKTQVNDKLIQYTMRFKLSHNTINNIL